ncbi:MAG TPA: DUF4465 domain-containing protein [Flavobacteriales bacterium]|nr:DUF4465 domain-containing protein [Flavobacteriales bacterium]HPH82086.1 DUF4465 domain-containing protein [Flavobacteriales bacterium]
MKIIFLTTLIFISNMIGFTQTTVDFEDLTLSPDSWWVGTDGVSTGFTSHNAFFPTRWDTAFGGYWLDGFAYSNMTDSVTSGYLNMYSCKAASGNDGSANYAIAYDDGRFVPGNANGLYAFEPIELYITNNTFAFNNMRDGDGFSKKFGGVSGNDPDFFKVTFTGIRNGEATGTDVVVHLADFTFEDNSLDYIQREWLRVDLTAMGVVDSIVFSFESSDVGEFGINTPKYFCLDDFKVNVVPNSINTIAKSTLSVFPNPVAEILSIRQVNPERIDYSIYSSSGMLVKNGSSNSVTEHVNVSELASGLYLIHLHADGVADTRTFVVQH